MGALRGRLSGLGLGRVAGLWLTIGVCMLVFTLENGAFLEGKNLLDLVRATSSLAIVALGQTLVIISGELDLSIGATYALAPVVLAVLWMNDGQSFYLALAIALLVGPLVGVVNAFFTTLVRIPSFVVTLGTLSVVTGTAILVGGAQYFTPGFVEPPLSKGELNFFHNIGGSAPGGVPAQVIWLVVIALLFIVIMHRSLFGFRVAAIGGNPDAARLARLPVIGYRFIAFMVCGLTAALAGIIDFSFLGSTQSSTSGSGLTFPVFAAVIIGGASLSGGSGTVIGTLSGAILLQVLSNGLSLLGVGGGYQLIFIGSITIAAVALDRWAVIASDIREKIQMIASARTRTSSP
jgi:ribose/xylose/arabinose/galactoside ABC-type transport system permease subunit